MKMSGQLYAPAALSPRYPLDRRLGGPQSRSGRGDEEKKPFSALAVKRTPVIQPAACLILIELPGSLS
jgi:hypothetical protein